MSDIRSDIFELDYLFTKAPMAMYIVDSDQKILKINEAAAALSGMDSIDLEGKRSGMVLSCINAQENSEYCISDDVCRHCVLHNTIQKTLDTGKDEKSVEARITRKGTSGLEELWILISTSLIDHKDDKHAMVCLEDITTQKNTEKALRDSESRYSTIFRNTHAIMMVIDPEDGKILNANNAALDYYGWSLKELRSKAIQEINTLSDEEVKAEIENAKSEKRNHFIFKHQLAGGEIRDVEVYSSPVQYGDRLALHSIIHDITNKLTAEKKLEESERTARALINASTESAFLIDRDGYFLTMNEVTAQRLRHSSEELIGKKAFDYIPPDVAKSRYEWLQKVLETGKPFRDIDERNGRVLDNNIYPIKDSDSHISRVAIFSRDITEETNNRNELAKVAKEWQTTFDTTNDAIFLLDKEMKIKRLNASAEKLFMRNGSSPIGRFCWEVVHKTKEPIEHCPTQEAKGTLKRATYDLNMENRWFRITVDPILDEQGLFSGAVHMLTDVTERTKAEQEKEKLIGELQQAIKDIKTLSGLIPICSHCKKIRDDKGYWNQLESYIEEHSESRFSHGLCPECMDEIYGDKEWYKDMKKKKKAQE